jgi:hypothetical protein
MVRAKIEKNAVLAGAALALILALAATAGAGEGEKPRVVTFKWRPPGAPAVSYEMPEPADQHRIVIFPGAVRGDGAPVVVGFHGQPKRGKAPRGYRFAGVVEEVVSGMIARGELRPVVLVLPVFRFHGGNWPGFDVKKLRAEVTRILSGEGIEAGEWFAFGHSGAAGCGGDGLNRAHRMKPKAVGFFDTCLGRGWQEEIPRLRKRGVATVNVHSVETAAFRPRQRPEYQSAFDFGRAYRPLGIDPVKCPASHPGERLRDQEYRCAATPDGVVRSFVVDTGEGVEAHRALLPVALRYFLAEFIGPSR